MDDKQPAVKTAGYPYLMPTAFYELGYAVEYKSRPLASDKGSQLATLI